jgi:hypothetical protein
VALLQCIIRAEGHVFKGAGERTFDMAAAVGQAFVAFAAELKSVGGDPFQAQKLSAIDHENQMPQNLLKRQVKRSDLSALRPVGAGQFGQVGCSRAFLGGGLYIWWGLRLGDVSWNLVPMLGVKYCQHARPPPLQV